MSKTMSSSFKETWLIKPDLSQFEGIWAVDFEFFASPGERVKPLCLVAWNLKQPGQRFRVWEDELLTMNHPPYPIDNNNLFISYNAPAELSCHLALGWGMPENILDLMIEFLHVDNGRSKGKRYSLLKALEYFQLEGVDPLYKELMRSRVERGGPWTGQEIVDMLDYCQTDVDALERLLPKMLPEITIPHALIRGRYTRAAAMMEYNGIPIDTMTFGKLRKYRHRILSEMIADIDRPYQVYKGASFKKAWFEDYLTEKGIDNWPTTPSGGLATSREVMEAKTKEYKHLENLFQLKWSVDQVRKMDKFPVGSDGRNRFSTAMFGSVTGRNQPSNARNIFGFPAWLRSLIRPEPGTGLVYLDWCQQEFGIAAALSEDSNMVTAYESGDSYMAFAKLAGAIPEDGTKEDYKEIREQYKECALALQYGMGAKTFSEKIKSSEVQAHLLIRKHKDTFPVFWEWMEKVVNYALLYGTVTTVFGWRAHLGRTKPRTNTSSIMNFSMQANGAEMLRLACWMMIDAGIKVITPVHDAILIESPLDTLDDNVTKAQDIMEYAAWVILHGWKKPGSLGQFTLRTDAKIIRYPDRYIDGRGVFRNESGDKKIDMWEYVNGFLDRYEKS